MIPDFRDDGYLPEGLHVACEADTTVRFGTATRQRQRLALRLRRWLELAHVIDAKRFFVDDSFVTSKPHPDDVDTVVWLPDDFAERLERGDDWLEFFGRTREADNRRKGVVEIKL
ncbi:DUF6932 family protein [Novipirellula maiorica]|uniref:DUF6932 family protein n=1 Tax=Novipirellula maiorica TaxID=1265734 RepID=UPI001181B32E|nr:hypothetical protein [Rhodopirellula maiorica]